MNVVFAQLAFDVCKFPFTLDVAEVEQGRVSSTNARRISMVEWLVSGSTLPA